MRRIKMLCVQSVMTALFLSGIGMVNVLPAQEIKQLKEPAKAEAKTDDAAQENDAQKAGDAQSAPNIAPGGTSQSYSVVIESKVGPDGKRVQTKKVWKDGVLVEDEEKTVEGTDENGDAAIELDGQIAPGIILRSERSGDFPFEEMDPNLSEDEMIQQMQAQMAAMRARQAEMMKRLGIPGFGMNAGPFDGMNDDMSAAYAKPSEYWLGVVIAPLSEVTQAQLGLSDGEGVVIRDLVPGGPAEKAGLAKNDILTKIDSTNVNSVGTIAETLDKIGDKTVKIEFYRKGKLETADLTPEKRPVDVDAPNGARIIGNGAEESFGPSEKIRVVRPGMIVPGKGESEPAESSEPSNAAEPEKNK